MLLQICGDRYRWASVSSPVKMAQNDFVKNVTVEQAKCAHHPHSQSCSQYEDKMSPFFHTGLAPLSALDGKSYTSILYGNGPGYALDSGDRPNVTEEESGKSHNVA